MSDELQTLAALKHSHFRVAIWLRAAIAQAGGQLTVTYDQIAAAAGVGRRTVAGALDELKRRQLIAIVPSLKRGGEAVTYSMPPAPTP